MKTLIEALAPASPPTGESLPRTRSGVGARRTPGGLRDIIQQVAREAGFDAVGITHANSAAHAGAFLDTFLDQERHGDMAWMETHRVRRRAVCELWPEARTAILLGLNYGPGHDPLDALAFRDRGNISVYARGGDYHDLIKAKLKSVAQALQAETGAEVKVFVDTAPLMEKPLAEAAGLGWQGKHTNLVSRDFGSWLFLGAVLTSAEITPDNPETDHCGQCRRCLDVCPTAAFPAPYQLDARRCISYLTIEHKGHIDREFREPMGNRIFGCDDCLAVCPWNKFAQEGRETKLKAREGSILPQLAELLALDDTAFRTRFAGTSVKRTGRDRFIRNVLIAAGNSGDDGLLPLVEALMTDASPLVRAMAVWACARLAEPSRLASLKAAHLPNEHDAAVRDEWLIAA